MYQSDRSEASLHALGIANALELIDATDSHRARLEEARADSRNNWRLIMLFQTIVVWMATTLILSKVDPHLVAYSSCVPLGLDLLVTIFNRVKHQ